MWGKTFFIDILVTDKKTKMCVDSGGSGVILNAGERGGPGPPGGGGGKHTVGIRQWRRLDAPRCQKAWGTSATWHQGTLMQRVHIIRESCAIICCSLYDCNHEPYLTVSICFRRINHMAVKNHLHSSSGVREVVSGTILTLSFGCDCCTPCRCKKLTAAFESESATANFCY
jgi:hypothetical protein